MATVRRWTGHEARALRVAKRMSVRQFAEHLGITAAAVSNWERRREQARLRYETQQILDTDLARSADDVRERFERSLAAGRNGLAAGRVVDPRGGAAAMAFPTTVDHDDLGRRSTRRTRALLKATAAHRVSPLAYQPPIDAIATVAGFISSPSRVYVIKGPPGSGKTRLTHHLAEQVATVDFQLHTAESWAGHHVNLATEILRYASTEAGRDPQLALERECALLARPTIVIIDGPGTEDEVHELCRQLDVILRQVLTEQLRFCLVLRTPPDVEFSAHPVLAASILQLPADVGGASLWLRSWTPGEAREAWDRSRTGDEQPFNRLPVRARHLARLPLYMHLLKTAGIGSAVGESSAYRLIDYCVRSIAATAGSDVDTVMGDLAALAEFELPHLLPDQLGSRSRLNRDVLASKLASGQTLLPLLRPAASGPPTFAHDVLREYFLATRLAQLIEERGRSSVTIAALNDLATRAGRSATTRGVLEFVIQCLDATAPDLLSAVSLSPTVGIAATLPLMLDVASEDAAFATDEVLRSCASRSLHESGLSLAKALLRCPRLAAALADHHARWLVEVLRQFGSGVWSDTVLYAETHLSASSLSSLLDAADFANPADAIFFARHAATFFGDDPSLAGQLKTLLEHRDWRVRAALASGIWQLSTPHPAADAVIDVLARDRDYKVRAAVAEAVGRLATRASHRYSERLAVDDNWHVRERLIRGFTTGARVLDERVCEILVNDESWRHCPMHVRTSMERLLLLTGVSRTEPTDARNRALFGLLREIRTGSLGLSQDTQTLLIEQARESTSWLVGKEAANLSVAGTWPADIRGSKESFRRLRDNRAVQVALDVRDLQQAVRVAEAAAEAGALFVEVGDPLIKSAGVGAIEQVKKAIPGVAVVAEMMSADWGRDQVVLAAEAGADVVLLIGPASTASVSAAVEASRRFGVPLMLDVPHDRFEPAWVHDMERAGVDGFAITTNIDLGVAGPQPLEQARTLRSWTRLPVAVSGGFGIADEIIDTDPTWDILIVGRSVTDAVDPATAAGQLISYITTLRSRTKK